MAATWARRHAILNFDDAFLRRTAIMGAAWLVLSSFAMASIVEEAWVEGSAAPSTPHSLKVGTGGQPEHRSFSLEGAEVDAFNFNLSISFSEQVGFELPTDGGLSLRLIRHYNSSAITLKSIPCFYSCQDDAGGPGDDFYPPLSVRSPLMRSYASFSRQNPMGLGWQFHLGIVYQEEEQYPPEDPDYAPPPECFNQDADEEFGIPGLWIYLTPEGMKHKLVPRSSDATEEVYETIDGSMIRAVRKLSPLESWTLFLADGRILEMEHRVNGDPYYEYYDPASGGAPTASCYGSNAWRGDEPPPGSYELEKLGWYTTRIRGREEDANGSPTASIQVSYHQPPFDYIISEVWDSHGSPGGARSIEVLINADDPQSVSYGHITDIKFPAPPDVNGNPRPKSVTHFTYEEREPHLDAVVDVLTRVDFPNGYSIEYDYHDRNSMQLECAAGTPHWPCNRGGQLSQIRYPSGKVVQFDYGLHRRKWRKRDGIWGGGNPSGLCACTSAPMEQAIVIGVTEKREYSEGLGGPHKTWTLGVIEQDLTAPDEAITYPGEVVCVGGALCGATHKLYNSTSFMIDPSGNRTEIKFDTTTGDAFGPTSAAASSYFGSAIEEKYFEGPGDHLVKRVTRTWEDHDNAYYVVKRDIPWLELVEETTEYLDDVSGTTTYLTTTRDNWQELQAVQGPPAIGHYQTTTAFGNGVGDITRTVETKYAIHEPNCSIASQLHDSWLPNIVGGTKVTVSTEGGPAEVVEATQYGFSTTTGRVLSSVTKLDPGELVSCPTSLEEIADPGDSVSEYVYSAAGNISRTTTSLWGSGQAPIEVETFWEYGVPIASRNLGVAYFDSIATVDPATSYVLQEEFGAVQAGDPLAVKKTTAYDEVGRPVRVQVGSQEPVVTEYIPEPLDGGFRLAAVRTTQGTGDQLTETIEHRDFSGRAFKLEKLNPDGTRAYRHTRYDSKGRVVFVSEWTSAEDDEAGLPGTTTDYTDYTFDPQGLDDPFDRPHRVVGPLGELTRYEYFGTNKRVIVEGVSVPTEGGTPGEQLLDSVTTYYVDALGRLRIVDSPQTGGTGVPTSPSAHAIYTYDHADRLVGVKLVDDYVLSPNALDRYHVTNLVNPQERSFTYDPLGRQTSATHPESGTATTVSWNPLGAPTRVQDAMGALRGHHHEITYDQLGRPTRVERVLDDGVGMLVEPTWDPSGGWNTAYSQACLGSFAWYNGDATCRYAQGATQFATLTSEAIAIPSEGAHLALWYFREVRDNVGEGSSRDRFRILVDHAPADWIDAEEVFALDSKQLSWSRWRMTPALSLEDYAGDTVQVRIEFDSVDDENITPARGIGIGDAWVFRTARVVLQEIAYDETFGNSSNKSRGRPTTYRNFDESTESALFTKRLYYAQPEGLLSAESWWLDWDRDGQYSSFEGSYAYDEMGRLESRDLPHLVGETAVRELDYIYRRGALVGVSSTVGEVTTPVIPDAPTAPGIEYNLAGGPELIRYGNGTRTHIEPNSAFLPNRFWVDRIDVAPLLFATGLYQYDGARNITGIGADSYRYDLSGRLLRAKVSATVPLTLTLDYRYDRYGNMTHQDTGGQGPIGLHFANRTYVNNQIADAGFQYDANGNLTVEPLHDGVGGYRYAFTPENRLDLVRGLNGGTIYQESLYDTADHRWSRVSSGDGGKALLTLRDASGQVAAEYEEASATSGLEPVKHYVRANGNLAAVHAVCGPPPVLTLVTPPPNAPNLTLTKVDTLEPIGDYTIIIQSSVGSLSSMTLPANSPDTFTIPYTALLPGNNWIRIKADVDCEWTSYSNAISIAGGGGSTCLETVEVGHSDFDQGGSDTTVELQANHVGCDPGHRFKAYFLPEGSSTPVLLEEGLLTPYRELRNTPKGAGHGEYWFVAYDPVTRQQTGLSPHAMNNTLNSSDGSGTMPGVGTWKTEYVHADHLGSTRLITDELGQKIGQYKYYPFGHEASVISSSDLRMLFTGHERDNELELDYMLARYYSTSLSRFLSTDPGDDTYLDAPQSWNKYSYVRNNPIRNRDPDGRIVETAFDVAMAGISIKQAWSNPSFGNIAGAVLDVAAVVIPVVPAVGGRAIDAAQAGATIVNRVDTATDAGKAASAAGDASGQARFVVEPNGTAVDTAATPAGRYQQPDGSLTDVLQKNDHGSGHSHTHEVRVDQNPQDPSKGSTRTTGKTHAVTYDEARNIESGKAKPVDSKPKRRQ